MHFRTHFRIIVICFLALIMLPLAKIVSAVEPTKKAPSSYGITEVLSLREEYVKHFDLGNGVYQAVVYDSAVHRLDAFGNWQEINNNLYIDNARTASTYSCADGQFRFAASLYTNQPIFEINNQSYSISMALASNSMLADEDYASVEAIVTNTPEKRTANATYETLDEAVAFHNISTILYEDIIDGIDLEYILVGNDIKENIIVKDCFDTYCYCFALNLNGLYPVLSPDGSVLLLDNKTAEEKYVIPSPYMYDSNNAVSSDVAYALSQQNETWYLTVTANETWINSPERSFPITIDPTLKASSNVQDTYVTSAHPATNYGNNGQLWISRPNSDKLHSATYIRFGLPNIPANSTISSASINTYYCYPTYVTTGHITLGAYQMEYAWTEENLTWNLASNCGPGLGTSSSILSTGYAMGDGDATPYSPNMLTLPITQLVRSWYNGTPNHGIVLKYIVGDNLSVIIKSSENTTGDYCPWLNIKYELPEHIHHFEINQSSSAIHPHKIIGTCACGVQHVSYQLKQLCDKCRENEKLATETKTEPKVFVFVEDDKNFGISCITVLECTVTYINYYDFPYNVDYSYPPFASFFSIVKSSAQSSESPSLNCISDLTVTYYDASGEVLWEQPMQWNLDNDAIPLVPMNVYTLDEKPAYAVAGATFAMPGSAQVYRLNVISYFSE